MNDVDQIPRLRVKIFWRAPDGRAGVFDTGNDVALYADDDPEYESGFGLPRGWHTWIWEEGNFSCDCNKSLFFLPDEPEWPCGDSIVIEKMEPFI